MSIITVDPHDDLPAFVGLELDEDSHPADPLHGVRTRQLNLLLHLIAEAQMRSAAPRRIKGKPARDEALVLHSFWLRAITRDSRVTTNDRVLNLGVTMRDVLQVEMEYGNFIVTVKQPFAYPAAPFVRIPLPIPVGDKRVTHVWMKTWHAVHRGQESILLSRWPNEAQLALLNDQLRRLNDSWRLRKHGIRIPRRVALSVEDGLRSLVLTMPQEHRD